jgi:hypothetical protein
MGRFQNNPSIGWVQPKSTQVRPLAWGNKKNVKIFIIGVKWTNAVPFAASTLITLFVKMLKLSKNYYSFKFIIIIFFQQFFQI